jgi:non-heme chloroperoxidase
MPLNERENAEITAAQQSGKQPVLFVHGLWLLANSWEAWRSLFEEKGYVTAAPGWPDDPDTTAEGVADPARFAGKGVAEITDHYAEAIGGLTRKPIIIGHSFGGLIAQKLAGTGLAAGTVAIDPAPFRGVLPLPLSALKASFPALKDPRNRKQAVMLTLEQFTYGFANQVPADEAKALYEKYAVPGAGRPLFQAASANINPKTPASVDTKRSDRGPLLIISGQQDHTVPWAIANASDKRYKTVPAEIIEIPGRGHSLVIDSGWGEVAQAALSFLDRTGLTP